MNPTETPTPRSEAETYYSTPSIPSDTPFTDGQEKSADRYGDCNVVLSSAARILERKVARYIEIGNSNAGLVIERDAKIAVLRDQLTAATARAAELEGALQLIRAHAVDNLRVASMRGDAPNYVEIVANAILAKHQPVAPSLPSPTGTKEGA